MEISDSNFIVIKGFIDAKTEKDSPVFGSFVALASRRDIHFVSTYFAKTEIPKDTYWKKLIDIHDQNKGNSERDQMLIKCEDLMQDFFFKNNILNSVAKNRNTKPAEQAISRFCMDSLSIRSVTFLEFQDASDPDIEYLKQKRHKSDEAHADQGNAAGKSGGQTQTSDMQSPLEGQNEIFVKCEPILDPIRGVAANEIRIGDIVCANLPKDSVFFKLLSKSHSLFDGMVSSEVTGILVNELGFATISLKLSDNVVGVLKTPGKVKLRVASLAEAQPTAPQRRPLRLTSISPETIIAFSVILILCSVLLAVYFIFMDV